MSWLGAIATLLTAATAIAGGVFAIYRYFAMRERLASVRTAFAQVLDLLGSDDAVHRRAGAIMLRRFFDDKTEQGGRGTPYAAEALNVIAATLRGIETGILQKLLADGLAYAPDTRGADLQKTNLQQAYLGTQSGRAVDLSGADFFRADLSGASLKGAVARGAVFYQARLANTVLRDADLEEANFYEADLTGARFDGARLRGANFANARNVPAAVLDRLDGAGVYDGSARGAAATPRAEIRPSVFLSRPGSADIETRKYLRALTDLLTEQHFDVVELERDAYALSGALAEVRRVMSMCAGMVVIAAPDLVVERGVWRSATPERRVVEDAGHASPWTTLELGVAAGLGLPVMLVLADGVDDAAFDFGAQEPGMALLRLTEDHRSQAFRERFDDWVGAVREHTAR